MVYRTKGCWQVKRASREKCPLSKARRRYWLFSESSFRVGRQTEIGCRDCWQRGLDDLGDKGKIRNKTVVFQFILVKIWFSKERCNESSFEKLRKDARGWVDSARAAREGRRVSRHSISRSVGIGSSWQVLGANIGMGFLTTDSETGLKVQSGTPSNGFVRGRENWCIQSRLILMILSRKKVVTVPEDHDAETNYQL